MTRFKTLLRYIGNIPRAIAVHMIAFYQATLSPDHGPLRHLYPQGFCRHEPTCSEYGKHMIAEHGVAIGGAMLVRRLLSCHPWSKPTRLIKTNP
jgi:hypothetical protein